MIALLVWWFDKSILVSRCTVSLIQVSGDPHSHIICPLAVLVGTNSTPLEYIEQIADYYVRQWAMNVRFDDGTDLGCLYDFAAEYFYNQTLADNGVEGDLLCGDGRKRTADAEIEASIEERLDSNHYGHLRR